MRPIFPREWLKRGVDLWSRGDIYDPLSGGRRQDRSFFSTFSFSFFSLSLPFFPSLFFFSKKCSRELDLSLRNNLLLYRGDFKRRFEDNRGSLDRRIYYYYISFPSFSFLFSRIQSGAGISQICVAAIDQGKFIIIGGAIKPSICKTSMRDTRATCFSWR